MRFKVVLSLNRDISGNVMPISYQYELCSVINRLLTADIVNYQQWLQANNLTVNDAQIDSLYSLSNLYVPRLFVQEDRMTIQVPRIQFWISFYHHAGTYDYVTRALLNKPLVIGDRKSQVHFIIESIEPVSPVEFKDTMVYQTISPVAVIAIRSNQTIEYLEPSNQYFSQFIVEELIERWEHINHTQYLGSRQFRFNLLVPPKRKAVIIMSGTPVQEKIISYMIKFELTMDPMLQEIAYDLGIGNNINYGFGYVELLYKD